MISRRPSVAERLIATLIIVLLANTMVFAQNQADLGPCAAIDALPKPAGLLTGTLQIVQICRAGRRIASATIGVQTGSTAAIQSTVTASQSFASPVTFTTPADTSIDVFSANGNFQRIAPRTTIAQFVGKFGEVFNVAVGHISAFVTNRLSFYTVQSLNVTAASRGTIFDVDAEPGVSIAFHISEGKLGLTRLVAIRLDAENRTVDGIRETDTITPAGPSSVKYAIPFPIYQDFANAAAARAFFQNQLATAEANGDEFQVENSLQNLARLDDLFPPATAPQHASNSENAARGVEASARAAGTLSGTQIGLIALAMVGSVTGIASTTKGPTVSAPVATPAPTTQTGTIGLQSRRRASRTFAFALALPIRL